MFTIDPPREGDKLAHGRTLTPVPEQQGAGLEQRGDRDAVASAELSEGITRVNAQPDMQVPPLHESYSYSPAQSEPFSAPSWLQHFHDEGTLSSPAFRPEPEPRTPARSHGEVDEGMARVTAERALALFCDYQRRRNLSPSTIMHRRIRVRTLMKWAETRDKDLLDLTGKDIDRWLDKQNRPDGLSPQTRYTYISLLAAFYSFAAKERIIRKDPTEDLIRPKLPTRVPRPWDPAEIAGAIMLADDRMRCWLLLAWFAGARVMEMASLRVEDIYPDSLLLHGKGNKERVVPLHPEVKRALVAFGLPRAGYVFRRRDGQPLKPNSLSHYISNYLRSVGSQATAHMGRHRYGTDMYELSEGDLLMVAGLMGHSSTQTTLGYAEWARTRANEVVAKLALPSLVDSPQGV